MDPYKIAHFARGKIPAALKNQHQIKAGVRVELVVREGAVVYVDDEGKRQRLQAGEMVAVPPTLKHHLEEADDAAIELRFFKTANDP